MKTLQRTVKPILVGLLGVFVLAGCNDKVTRDRYNIITQNVDAKMDVERILGEPDVRTPEMWMYNREGRGITVKIEFDTNDTVVHKLWIDDRGYDESGETEFNSDGDSSSYESTSINSSRQ